MKLRGTRVVDPGEADDHDDVVDQVLHIIRSKSLSQDHSQDTCCSQLNKSRRVVADTEVVDETDQDKVTLRLEAEALPVEGGDADAEEDHLQLHHVHLTNLKHGDVCQVCHFT